MDLSAGEGSKFITKGELHTLDPLVPIQGKNVNKDFLIELFLTFQIIFKASKLFHIFWRQKALESLMLIYQEVCPCKHPLNSGKILSECYGKVPRKSSPVDGHL